MVAPSFSKFCSLARKFHFEDGILKILLLYINGAADYESEVRITKLKMAGPRDRS